MKNDTEMMHSEPGVQVPFDKELESQILGGLMFDTDGLHEGIHLLREEFFYESRHLWIFREIRALFDADESVDIITVSQALKKRGLLDKVGGAFYIQQLTNTIVTTANIVYLIRVLTQLFLKRKQIEICGKALDDAYDNRSDVFETQDFLENSLSELNRYIIGNIGETDLKGGLKRTMEKILDPGKRKGIPTGNPKLDELTNGWQLGDFNLLGARPSMGKTSRALQFAVVAAEAGYNVGFFSLEMGEFAINYKLINLKSAVSNAIMKTGTWAPDDMDKMNTAVEHLGELPLFLNYDSGITMREIGPILREWKRKNNTSQKQGLHLVFIDYIQLMGSADPRAKNREQIVSDISQGLKKLAKRLNICIVALSQLSRELEKRMDKRPMQSDLRESGQLEQDADAIFMLYRPSKYWVKDADPDYKNAGFSDDDYKMLVEIGIPKQRMGRAGVKTIEYFDADKSIFNIEPTNTLRLEDEPF